MNYVQEQFIFDDKNFQNTIISLNSWEQLRTQYEFRLDRPLRSYVFETLVHTDIDTIIIQRQKQFHEQKRVVRWLELTRYYAVFDDANIVYYENYDVSGILRPLATQGVSKQEKFNAFSMFLFSSMVDKGQLFKPWRSNNKEHCGIRTDHLHENQRLGMYIHSFLKQDMLG